jgi:hypothetical protein
MVGVAHIPRNREKTLATSPQTASSAAVDGGNQLQSNGEQEKIKPLVVLAAAVAAIGGKQVQSQRQTASLLIYCCLLESKLRGLAMLALQPSLCNFNVLLCLRPAQPHCHTHTHKHGNTGLIFGYDIGGSGGTFTMHGFRRQMVSMLQLHCNAHEQLQVAATPFAMPCSLQGCSSKHFCNLAHHY